MEGGGGDCVQQPCPWPLRLCTKTRRDTAHPSPCVGGALQKKRRWGISFPPPQPPSPDPQQVDAQSAQWR